MNYLWNPPAPLSLPIRGKSERLPINRIFCVGRNYHAHAQEMGRPVDKASSRPFYFTQSPQTLVQNGGVVPYPPQTQNFHFEMELVVVIGKADPEIKARYNTFAFEALNWSPEEIRKQAEIKSKTYGKLVARKNISLE